ncbi:hypothetical protein [Kitasatospora sp. NPDC091207]|uniref:hypothetical protein n=1 Tax=Kitasatospora sp. NPDC091207 TaxID=3364083 RepID=UPI0038257F86
MGDDRQGVRHAQQPRRATGLPGQADLPPARRGLGDLQGRLPEPKPLTITVAEPLTVAEPVPIAVAEPLTITVAEPVPIAEPQSDQLPRPEADPVAHPHAVANPHTRPRLAFDQAEWSTFVQAIEAGSPNFTA